MTLYSARELTDFKERVHVYIHKSIISFESFINMHVIDVYIHDLFVNISRRACAKTDLQVTCMYFNRSVFM